MKSADSREIAVSDGQIDVNPDQIPLSGDAVPEFFLDTWVRNPDPKRARGFEVEGDIHASVRISGILWLKNFLPCRLLQRMCADLRNILNSR